MRASKLVATACLLLASDVGHSAQKRREISEKEAHHLLTKYLKLADRAVYRLGSDFGYNGFHFFQAEEGVASANLKTQHSAYSTSDTTPWIETPLIYGTPGSAKRYHLRL